ncbi:MAG: hypothetical protein Q4G60_04175 [bacterium]|nr:hypothetical protein [bacterium]
MTKEQMTLLLSDLTSGYGIRQIFAILLIFLIGFIFLYGVREKIRTQWLLALAYPVGLALWCVAGFLLLTLGVPFCLFSELAMIALILAVSVGTAGLRYRFRERPVSIRRPVITLLAASALLILVAAVAVSGILSISTSNDTMYYYLYYPEVLVKEGVYLSAYDVFLSDVGPMAALIGTIPAMLGFDQFYGIQQVFNLNFILLFAMFSYERSREKLQEKQAMVITAVMTVLLITATPFVVLSKWILANVYVMAYSFLLFGLAYKIDRERKEGEQENHDAMLVFMLLSAVISMLRMEGGMLMCFMIVCISTLGYSNRELLTRFLLPASVMPCLYYIRYFAFLKVSPVYSFLTWQKAAVAIAVMVLLGHYIGGIRGKHLIRLQKNTGWLILIGLLAVNGGLFVLAPSDYLVVAKAFLQNVVYREGWGYTIDLVLICYIMIYFVEKTYKIKQLDDQCHEQKMHDIQYENLFLLGYILFTVAVSFARGGGLRRGIGDSGNRVMLQVIPFLIYALTCRVIHVTAGLEGSAAKRLEEGAADDVDHDKCR